MKLYTKRGDDGGTDLFGGQRVAKDDLRVEAYGTVDELNSTLGLAATACDQTELTAIFTTLQNRLFDLGADLATPTVADDAAGGGAGAAAARKVRRIDQTHIDELERLIDRTCEPLPAMRYFVLPGGTELAARLHVARTVCRRAERLCVRLGRSEPVGTQTIIFLNRLSDLLFAMARRANQLAGVEDVAWKPE